jgi:hypothetical protein
MGWRTYFLAKMAVFSKRAKESGNTVLPHGKYSIYPIYFSDDFDKVVDSVSWFCGLKEIVNLHYIRGLILS